MAVTSHSRQIEVNGKKLWRVDVEETRSAVFYVLGDDREAAKKDAQALGEQIESDEWDDVETDVSTMPARSEPFPNQMVWSGGDKGEYLTWAEVIEDEGTGK